MLIFSYSHTDYDYIKILENRLSIFIVQHQFGYSQFDLPRHKFVAASEAWLGIRNSTLDKNIDLFAPNLLEGVCEYLFMDFHALMNNEIFYSHQPMYLRNGFSVVRQIKRCSVRQIISC